MVRPATRHGLRLAGDTTNKLKADPEYEAHQRVGDGALRKLAARLHEDVGTSVKVFFATI
jgi:hypothetical protein